MTQFEFYKSFQFTAELLVAEALFSTHLKMRRFFVLRAVFAVILVFLFSYLFPVPTDHALYMSFMFLSIFIFTVAMGKFLYREKWLKILFCFIAGYTVQHLAYECYNLSMTAMGLDVGGSGLYGSQHFQMFPNAFVATVYFFLFISIYFFSCYFFANKIEREDAFQLKYGFVFVLVVFILAIDIILNAIVVRHLSNGDLLYYVIVEIYNILCCVIVLYLQFEVLLRRRLQETLHTVEQLRHKEREQYQISKENIELINMKCHDLKHQIRTIGSRDAISEESVREIEDLISIYDSTVRTGNAALDLILSEKSLLCNKNGIKLTLIVDGQLLAFMRDEDIYSLFGNLIDNAIEAVGPLEEGKRVIGLKVRAIGTMLSVNIHNYYAKELVFENGIPKTTKADKDFHGFGLKSVKYISERYGGNLSISTQNDVFTINILFSLHGPAE